jgi:hypothetical protein
VAFGYVQVPVSGLPCPLASSLPIGKIYTGSRIAETLLIHCTRYLIWIGETHCRALTWQAADDEISPYPGSDQEKTFGPTISGLIHRHIGPERLLLWDSKLRGGRPDTMKILKEAYDYWGAEGLVHTALRMHAGN